MLLFGFILSVCLFFSFQQRLLALEMTASSDPRGSTNFYSSLQGYSKLESAVDQYLIAIPLGYYTIANVESLKRLMAEHQALLVDVREPSEYGSGHIPGAINIPLRKLARNLNNIPSDRPVVLYCTTGYRSSMGVMTLHLLNYDNVQGFPPSLAGWIKAGEAIAKH
jgi:rhodanese-related sulfurtransferase